MGITSQRAVLIVDEYVYDIEAATGGALGSDALSVLEAHTQLSAVAEAIAATADTATSLGPMNDIEFDAPVPCPGSCFAVGLNYSTHVDEAGMDPPEAPVVFTKFPASIAGPKSTVQLLSEFADYEVELVVVIGTEGANISRDDAWHYVAGLTVGNDISDRALQFAAKPPHFSLGKSRTGYGPIGPIGPIGPTIVSVDSFDDPENLELSCTVNGEERQRDFSSNLIFDIPFLINYLSSIVTLRPGDLIFTGTPSGVGGPKGVFLKPGDHVVCTVDGIGSIETICA